MKKQSVHNRRQSIRAAKKAKRRRRPKCPAAARPAETATERRQRVVSEHLRSLHALGLIQHYDFNLETDKISALMTPAQRNFGLYADHGDDALRHLASEAAVPKSAPLDSNRDVQAGGWTAARRDGGGSDRIDPDDVAVRATDP
jgi:galactokinase